MEERKGKERKEEKMGRECERKAERNKSRHAIAVSTRAVSVRQI